LYAPLDRTFPTVTGSYVDPDARIALMVDEAGLDDAIRALVRIGLDEVWSWAPPSLLAELAGSGHPLARIPEIDMTDVDAWREDGGSVVVDVRRGSEFREGHVPGALNHP